MNDGVAMLLERMKTNPEEFVAESSYGVSKWGSIMQEYRPYLDKEDLDAFDTAHKETVFKYMQQRFTEKVMEELIDPKDERKTLITSTPWDARISLNNTATHTANALTIGNTTLTEDSIKRILKNQSATPIAGVTQTV